MGYDYTLSPMEDEVEVNLSKESWNRISWAWGFEYKYGWNWQLSHFYKSIFTTGIYLGSYIWEQKNKIQVSANIMSSTYKNNLRTTPQLL